MKKTYFKPILCYERFDLMESIAGDCGLVLTNSMEYYNCSGYLKEDPTSYWLMDGAAACASFEKLDDDIAGGFGARIS